MATDVRNRNTGRGTQNNNNGVGAQYVISGGEVHFIANFDPSDRNAYKTLWDAVADIGASHDAEQQYERGECLPKTREKALAGIFDWILSPGEQPILWLTGAAGVGKTAIAITIAKSSQEDGHLVTSFFFFRADSKRNNPFALILTIAFGLITTVPLLRNPIEQRISRDPRILKARMEDQFRELVVKPVAHQQTPPSPKPRKSSSRRKKSKRVQTVQTKPPYLVIIDGLDECGDEETQKRVLSTIQSAFENTTSFPLRFLICSRPEAWLQEAFASQPLRQISKVTVLDESFKPREDIATYYHHHFREITTGPKYKHVEFPTPWPSQADFEALMEQTGSQFVYAATAVRFIQSPFTLPTEQLQVILKVTSPDPSGTSPFAQLDALYKHIVGFNPNYEDVRPILAAILVIPEDARTPACIELVLGLSKGRLALMLRGMYSVLDIRDSDDEILPFHNSFREYLVDANRSGPFHIDIQAQTRIIVQKWLQNFLKEKIQGYSSSQLWNEENEPFFWAWCIFFIDSVPEPTQDLLDVLCNIDLVAPFIISGSSNWDEWYRWLASWVRENYLHPMAGENQAASENGDHGNPAVISRPNPDGYSSYDNGQPRATPLGREIDTRRDDCDLAERLLHKLENHPQCFHLEWRTSVSPPDSVVNWIVRRATGCRWETGVEEQRPSAFDDIQVTECGCDLSGGKESRDRWHVAYQEGCLKFLRAYIDGFEEVSQSGAENKGADGGELWGIFRNLTESVLLKHCRLDTEVLSLCRKFFELANGALFLQLDSYDGMKGRQNMLKWIETFPEKFAADGEALKTQLLGLPWGRWGKNYQDLYG